MRSHVRRGFTLLEAAAALVVIGISSAAALGGAAAEMRAAGRTRHALTAQTLADQRMATLRLLSREELLRLPDSLAKGTFDAPLEEYHWRAATAPARDGQDLFDIRVMVGWTDGSHIIATRSYRPPEHLRGR